MKIEIRKFANKGLVNQQQVCLNERLPAYVHGPVSMDFSFSVTDRGEYYLLNLSETANIELICQRCGDVWQYHHQQHYEFAVCSSEEIAEKYQSLYDPLVAENGMLDFLTILTDNMYLFLPVNHENLDCCNQDQLKLIQAHFE
jgi:uncharacterized metal-binding protein YceD (DUF177 family)